MEESFPYEALLRVRGPFSRASAAGAAAKVTRDGDTIRLQTAAVHEAVVIED
jgi:hypothetical protein